MGVWNLRLSLGTRRGAAWENAPISLWERTGEDGRGAKVRAVIKTSTANSKFGLISASICLGESRSSPAEFPQVGSEGGISEGVISSAEFLGGIFWIPD